MNIVQLGDYKKKKASLHEEQQKVKKTSPFQKVHLLRLSTPESVFPLDGEVWSDCKSE